MPLAIAKLSDEELRTVIVNCLRRRAKIADPEAEQRIVDCVAELDLRGADTEGEPLLARLGYHTGANGLRWPERQLILDYILSGNLPTSKIYDAQRWGAPGARSRYTELRKALLLYLGRYGKGPGMSHAALNWQHDADYVKTAWQGHEDDG